MKGAIKWYNNVRGMGFIAGEDGTDYFAHYTGFELFADGGRVRAYENQECEFEPEQSEKGPRAAHIVLGAEPEHAEEE